ncbi:MAG: asparagine synthase (glutamine-hydrolyzing) [Oscillospiraceae bacterium]|nr:asparagine synthase (glutamine-hydrolyzing) [Oscillospiraceae bacterium]
MCSIAGVIDFAHDMREEGAVLDAMHKSMTHRGPDQSGTYFSPSAALLHNRLCVIDIENGRQPMTARQDGNTYTLVYNGELYNTDELRTQLMAAGHRFTGHSDTEVLLRAYIQWGGACVEKLNGIFAFAIYEEPAQRLFIARDRMGVKPFFYALRGGAFLFASELKGLLAHPLVKPQADRDSVLELLLIGPGRTPGCGVFRDIAELPPGCRGWFDRNGLKTEKYWSLQAHTHHDSLDTTIDTVRYLVTDAIQRQLVSDVPVGTFLSGGLDSGIICSIANRYMADRGRRLTAFSVDYRDSKKYFHSGKFQPNSDTDYIPLLRDWLGCEHHLVILDTDELVEGLFEAVDARDLPGMADVDSSLLQFCKRIKEHVTVTPSGECADEIFGGYPWYRDEQIRMAEGFPWAQSTQYRAGFLREEYLRGVDPREYVMARYRATVADASTLPGDDLTDRRMREMMRLNTDWFMQTLLDRKDRMSMYSALEVRVPFCDHRIAEYLYSIPWEWKNYRHYEKGLLRAAMKDIPPEEILWRKKSPYPKTHNPAYMSAVSARLRAVMENSASPLLRIVKKEALEALLNDDKAQPWYGQLMTTPQTVAYMLQINYWLEKYKVELV